MSDRIAVMRDGRIEQLGTPEDLYERPRTEFVAGFLGVTNLLEADVVGRRGGLAELRLSDGTLLSAPAEQVNGAQRVRLGVRPEKLRAVPRGSEGAASADEEMNTLEGTVVDASYVGVSTQYIVATKDGHRLTVYAQNLATSGASGALAGGEDVTLTWLPQHTFVIDQPDRAQARDAEQEATE